MFICAAGEIHGALDRLYEDVFAFETLLGIRFDYVLKKHRGPAVLPEHWSRNWELALVVERSHASTVLQCAGWSVRILIGVNKAAEC